MCFMFCDWLWHYNILHVSLQSSKFVLKSITVTYIHAIHVCIFYVYNLVQTAREVAVSKGLKLQIVGFELEAIHGFRFVVRTWTEASRLYLAGTTCTILLQLLQGSWSVVFLPLTNLFKPFCLIFLLIQHDFEKKLKLRTQESVSCKRVAWHYGESYAGRASIAVSWRITTVLMTSDN